MKIAAGLPKELSRADRNKQGWAQARAEAEAAKEAAPVAEPSASDLRAAANVQKQAAQAVEPAAPVASESIAPQTEPAKPFEPIRFCVEVAPFIEALATLKKAAQNDWVRLATEANGHATRGLLMTVCSDAVYRHGEGQGAALQVGSWIPALVENGGEIIAPLATLREIAATLNKKDKSTSLYIEKIKAGDSFLISYARARWQLAGGLAEDFPAAPVASAMPAEFDASASSLRRALETALEAAPKKDTREILLGVHLASLAGNSGLQCVGTDGKKLFVAVAEGRLASEKAPVAITLPRRAVETIIAALPKTGIEPAEIRASAESLRLVVGSTTIFAEAIQSGQGMFPKWKSVVPRNFARKFEFSPADLLQEVKRAKRANAETIALEFQPDDSGDGWQILLSALQSDAGQGNSHLECSFAAGLAEPIKVWFNVAYLERLLANLKSAATAVIQINKPASAVVFHALNRPEEIRLLMPVKLTEYKAEEKPEETEQEVAESERAAPEDSPVAATLETEAPALSDEQEAALFLAEAAEVFEIEEAAPATTKPNAASAGVVDWDALFPGGFWTERPSKPEAAPIKNVFNPAPVSPKPVASVAPQPGDDYRAKLIAYKLAVAVAVGLPEDVFARYGNESPEAAPERKALRKQFPGIRAANRACGDCLRQGWEVAFAARRIADILADGAKRGEAVA